MANYIWGWQLPEDTKAISRVYYTDEELHKSWYVNKELNDSVAAADCGWYGISYAVTEDSYGDRREWALMFADKDDSPRSARWIPVTGNSKGAIAENVWSLVFR